MKKAVLFFALGIGVCIALAAGFAPTAYMNYLIGNTAVGGSNITSAASFRAAIGAQAAGGPFTGNGVGLTNLNVTNLTGTIFDLNGMYVDPTIGNDSAAERGPFKPYKTLTAALTAATTNTVYLNGHISDEDLYIPDGVSVRGIGPKAAITSAAITIIGNSTISDLCVTGGVSVAGNLVVKNCLFDVRNSVADGDIIVNEGGIFEAWNSEFYSNYDWLLARAGSVSRYYNCKFLSEENGSGATLLPSAGGFNLEATFASLFVSGGVAESKNFTNGWIINLATGATGTVELAGLVLKPHTETGTMCAINYEEGAGKTNVIAYGDFIKESDVVGGKVNVITSSGTNTIPGGHFFAPEWATVYGGGGVQLGDGESSNAYPLTGYGLGLGNGSNAGDGYLTNSTAGTFQVNFNIQYVVAAGTGTYSINLQTNDVLEAVLTTAAPATGMFSSQHFVELPANTRVRIVAQPSDVTASTVSAVDFSMKRIR